MGIHLARLGDIRRLGNYGGCLRVKQLIYELFSNKSVARFVPVIVMHRIKGSAIRLEPTLHRSMEIEVFERQFLCQRLDRFPPCLLYTSPSPRD